MEKIQKGVCPPPPISKILISSALAVLLGVSTEAGAVTENSNRIVFTSSDNTFTPSNGVYTTTQNKTIQVSKEVATAHFYGGITINGGNTTISMFGSSAPYLISQSFEFGSGVGTSTLQVAKNASLDFNFLTLGSAKNQSYNLSAMTSGAASGSIVNQGTMNFNLGENTKLYFKSYANVGSSATSVSLPISNSGTMNFNFSSNSEIHLDMSAINSTLQNQGVIVFDFSNTRNTALDGGELQNEASPMDTSSITFKFKNSQGVFFGNNSKITINNNDTDNNRGVVFSMEGNSLVALSQVALTNITFDFKGYGNILDLGEGFSSSDITNIDVRWFNSNGSSNITSLVALDNTGTPNASFLEVITNKFTFLEIGERGVVGTGISGNGMNFIVYANISKKTLLGQDIGADKNGIYTYADRVFIHSAQDNSKATSHNLGVIVSPSMLKYLDSVSYTQGDVTTKGNIAVATVANDSNVTLNALSGSLLGFNLIETSFEKVKTNDQGIIQGGNQNDPLNTYTTYFLSSARDMGVASVTQEVTSSVFALNYDLFIANFNSLNKRMGDLRNNPYSQGAWGRIFNGQLSNDFGLGSKNNYTTLQAGYDYDFGLENAKNYLGVAFSYGFSISEMSSNAKDALQSREIKDIFSNAIELALYNAYVSDSGLYSDSIAKFSYLMSDFNLTNNTTTESLSVNNYAFQLSEEVGYVFSLGGDKEWSITPQAELSFGYYSDSDLTQVAGDFYLDAKAKSMMMLRARVGSSFGYDFKRFTQDKDINASLYVGLSYEYDYLSGGDIELTPNVGQSSTTKSALSSDSRGVLNVGTNLAIKEQTRIYADIQTSFGGKITNDYQVNFGVRYSFGEKAEARGESISREQNLPLNPIKPQE